MIDSLFISFGIKSERVKSLKLIFSAGLFFSFILCLYPQCPDILTTQVTPNCIPSCQLCSGASFTVNLTGADLPNGGKIHYYASETPGFNPYNGEGTLLGSSNISTGSAPCRICPTLLGFMIDACGVEQHNEFVIIWTGSGFNTNDFNFDYDANNNAGGGNGDIGSGACSLAAGNAGLVSGCSAIPVGGGYNLPANAILIVFTSSGASTSYDFSSVCGLACNIFVSQSTCSRTIGAFSNMASTGLRTQSFSVDGCACGTTVQYDTDDPSLMGDGDAWAGGITNNGCSAAAGTPGSYTGANSTVTPFSYKIPDLWCGKTFEIVGIIEPKPEAPCCMEEFTDRFTIEVKCPTATPVDKTLCETGPNVATFNLSDLEADILNGSSGMVEWYRDANGTQRINSPYTTGTVTVYARVVDGVCKSSLVPIKLTVLTRPKGKPTFEEQCDKGGGRAEFELIGLIDVIKNGYNGTVTFYEDMGLSNEITPPYESGTKTIYAVINDGQCESTPIEIRLVVLDLPKAFYAIDQLCDEGGGLASFKLVNLIPTILGLNNVGKTVKFYSDINLQNEINAPYKTKSTKIYAQVFNGKCYSDPVEIDLKVINLQNIPFASDKVCDDGSGKAIFDLKDLIKTLTQNDTSFKLSWYLDSLKTQSFTPPITVSVTDTVYLILQKDSCKSNLIPVLLEPVQRPKAFPTNINLCADSLDFATFDLNTIIDQINGGNSNLQVIFAKDSNLLQLIGNRKIRTNRDTLWASTLDGACNSIAVKILLSTFSKPDLDLPSNLQACEFFILPPITGQNLTGNQSYFTLSNGNGQSYKPGDTIKANSTLYIFDQINNCSDELTIQIIVDRKPNAGTDETISICDGNVLDVSTVLRNHDPGGNFIDLSNSGSLNNRFFDTKGKSGGIFRIAYIIPLNGNCPPDTSFVDINVVKDVKAGQDTSINLCESALFDLRTLLRNADAGGQFINLGTFGTLNGTMWNSGPGNYNIIYEIGDSITCPKDTALLSIKVLPSSELNALSDINSCDYAILPALSGKNLLTPIYNTVSDASGINYQAGDTMKQSIRLFIFSDPGAQCSDVDTIDVVINPSSKANFTRTNLCSDQKFTIGQTTYSVTKPTGIEVLKNHLGCDSVITVDLNYIPEILSSFKQELCAGSFITVNGNRYDETKSKGIEILKNYQGCDSTVSIDLSFKATSRFSYIGEICKGEKITINNKNYDQNKLNGIDTLKNASGCDSIVTISLSLTPEKRFAYLGSICESDSLQFGNIIISKTNLSYLDTLRSASISGCDSIVDIRVDIKPEAIHTINSTLCDNQSLTIKNEVFNKSKPSGTVILNNQSFNGCDSIIQVNLKFQSSVSSNYQNSICRGDSILINKQWYNQYKLIGYDTLAGASSGGCDSIVNINVKIKEPQTWIIKADACDDDALIVNGIEFNKSNPMGVVTIKSGASNGCDSIVTVDLNFKNYDLTVTKNYSTAPGSPIKVILSTDMIPNSIVWTPNTGLSCTDCLEPEITVTETTSYTVTITDDNGCTLTATINIIVEVQDDVFIPTAFSPNGDGINDIFQPGGDANLKIKLFRVYDRWGELLYESKNHLISSGIGWDGTFNNSRVNPGVYVYYLSVEIPGRADKILQGDITLLK